MKTIKQSLHLGDLHLGISNDNPWHENIIREAISDAIAYSLEHNIKEWIQYGDFFDVRKAITHKTMEFAREIINKLSENKIHITVIVGNHDMHYKNVINPNAVTELLGNYENVTVVDKPVTLDHDFVKIDLIPWLCESNTSEVMQFIKKSKSEMCIGHWELNGFYFYKGVRSTGMDPNFLSKYKQVYSGHFHTISESGNIKYIGTPYTLTANDEDDIRGFYHLTENDFKFIQNNKKWHRKLYYPDDKDFNAEELKGCSVRVFIKDLELNKSGVDKDYEKFQSSLEKVAENLRFVNNKPKSISEEVETGELKTITSLISDTIQEMDLEEESKEDLLKMSMELYQEASA